jgi:hypothetical protein
MSTTYNKTNYAWNGFKVGDEVLCTWPGEEPEGPFIITDLVSPEVGEATKFVYDIFVLYLDDEKNFHTAGDRKKLKRTKKFMASAFCRQAEKSETFVSPDLGTTDHPGIW